MKLKRTSKLLALLLTLVMVVGLLPTVAFAKKYNKDEKVTFNITSANTTAKFDLNFQTNPGPSGEARLENVASKTGITLSDSPVELTLTKASKTTKAIALQAISTSDTDSLLTWKVSVGGKVVEYPKNGTTADAVHEGNSNVKVAAYISAADFSKAYLTIKIGTDTIPSDLSVVAVFSSGASAYTVKTAVNDEARGQVTVDDSGDNSYTLTAKPYDGYMLDYWVYKTGNDTETPFPDANKIVNPVDNSNATITETITENRTYKAVFKTAAPILYGGSVETQDVIHYAGWDNIMTDGRTREEYYRSRGFGAITSEDQHKSKSISELREAYIVLDLDYPYAALCSTDNPFTIKLYEGTKEEGEAPFATVIQTSDYIYLKKSNAFYPIIVPEMPNMTSFTVEARYAEEETSYQTYKLLNPVIADDLAPQKKAALAVLKTSYETLRATEGLSELKRGFLDSSYRVNKNVIVEAADEEAITEAKTAALAEMDGLVNGGTGLYAAVTVEAFKVDDWGLIVPPTLVEISDGTKVYTAIQCALAETYPNIPLNQLMQGSSGYIAAVYTPGYTGSHNGWNYLGEFDNGTDSGWVYCVDGAFPNKGVGEYTLDGGETIRLQYTKTGKGSDVQPASKKDNLIMAVAKLRSLYTYSQLMGTAEGLTADQTAAYSAAFDLVNTLFVDDDAAAAANTTLRAAFPDVFDPVDPAVENVIDLIKAIGTVTRDSMDAIEAAEEAYAALATDALKARVTNYQTLLDARETYDVLSSFTAGNPATALTGVLNWLKTNVTAPAVGSTNGEWAVLAMARGGVMTDAIKSAYLGNLNTALSAGDKIKSYTDNERVTLALSSLGVDASAYGATPADLTALYKAYVPAAQRTTDNQTLNADIYALLALNAKPYTGAQDSYVDAICAAAKDGGGWGLNAASPADADVTAMALQALAPYYASNATVKTKVDAALSWLKTNKQDPYTGAFKNYEGTVSTSSTAQVVTALCALGIDPNGSAWKTAYDMTPLSGLTLWYNGEGWFGETDTGLNQMATEQAAYALVAWDRYTRNTNSLYDMRDAFPTPKSSDASVTSVTVKGVAATAGAGNSFTAELPAGTDLAALTAADFTIVPAVNATAGTPTTADSGANWSFTVTAEDGTTTAAYTVALTVAAPSGGSGGTGTDKSANAAAVAAAKAKLPATLTASYTEVSNAANARSFVLKTLGALELDDTVTRTVTVTAVTPATAGSADNPAGTPGSFTATVTLSKGEDDAKAEDTATISGTITAKAWVDTSTKITVTMRLIGAEQAAKDVDLGATPAYAPAYVTWIPTTEYELQNGSTVYDLWTTATSDAGIRSVGAEDNYVKTVYAPEDGYALSEFTNGQRSGWMYTINGRHPGRGLKEQALSDGDVVIWHYVNDYAYEVADWTNDGQWQKLGNQYDNQWLKAPDTYLGKGGAIGSAEGGAGGSVSGSGAAGGSGSAAASDSSTVTADDGSQVTTETEKTVETKENDDGSVTEVVTETTKTTVTAPDGSVSTTETAVETETTTNSVTNADGTVTETTTTVEKVTETVTAADGTKQTVVTETEETKELNIAADADGKVSGTGTYSATSTVTVDGKKTTAVTEGTVAVSTDDKGTVSEVTTAKTVTTAPDGTKTETVAVITEAEMTNGTTGKVVADEQGNTISAEASVSQAALEAAVKSGEPIEIPVTVNAASGATVSISLEGAGEGSKLWVEIGTTDTAPGNVAYLKLADGVTKLLTTCKTGSVIVPVTGDCEVIVKDNSKSFTDVDAGAWYVDSVKFVTAREIFNGTGNGAFAPSATMNRAMAAQILYNLDGEAKAGDGTSFSDVTADDWFNGAVGWASGLGVITGYNGAYAPLDAVTRQDLVTILYRYAKQAGYDVSVGSSVNLTSYADGADVKDYAAEAMRWAIANGIIGGYTDGTLRPRNMATRAEVAAIMQRMVQNAVK